MIRKGETPYLPFEGQITKWTIPNVAKFEVVRKQIYSHQVSTTGGFPLSHVHSSEIGPWTTAKFIFQCLAKLKTQTRLSYITSNNNTFTSLCNPLFCASSSEFSLIFSSLKFAKGSKLIMSVCGLNCINIRIFSQLFFNQVLFMKTGKFY